MACPGPLGHSASAAVLCSNPQPDSTLGLRALPAAEAIAEPGRGSAGNSRHPSCVHRAELPGQGRPQRQSGPARPCSEARGRG